MLYTFDFSFPVSTCHLSSLLVFFGLRGTGGSHFRLYEWFCYSEINE